MFLEKYLPSYMQDQLEMKFMDLRQEETSVAEYEVKFSELSRFVPEYVNTEPSGKSTSSVRFQSKDLSVGVESRMLRGYSRDSQGRVPVPSVSGSFEVVVLDPSSIVNRGVEWWKMVGTLVGGVVDIDGLIGLLVDCWCRLESDWKMPPKKATQSKEDSSSLAEGPVINEILDLLRQQQQQQLQNWLKEMEKAFTLTQESARELEGENPVSWTRFTELFLEKYFPNGLRNQLEVEFLELKQGERSVLEYEAKFTELARLVPEYVSTEIQKARRFQQGLKPEIRRGVVALQLKTYSSMVQAALVVESDQKLVVKEESDKKRKSEGVMNKADQGGSSQEFENRFGRNRSKGFRRQSLFQARSSVTSIASTLAQSVKSAVDCKSYDKRHSGSCKKNVQ
ncbi:hypothetical protein AgCh_014156 [Apium graveolens]